MSARVERRQMPLSAALSTTLVTIVDEDPSVCRALRRLIESAGFAVETFTSGRQAFDFGLLGRTSCFVVDVRLGDMTGFDLGRLLAAEGIRIPMIFITAHDDARTEECARRAGAVAYLAKPIDGDVLLEAIRRAVRGRPQAS